MLNFQGLVRLRFSSWEFNIEMIESELCNVIEHKSSLFSLKNLTNQNPCGKYLPRYPQFFRRTIRRMSCSSPPWKKITPKMIHFCSFFWDIRVQLILTQRSIFNLSTSISIWFSKGFNCRLMKMRKVQLRWLNKGFKILWMHDSNNYFYRYPQLGYLENVMQKNDHTSNTATKLSTKSSYLGYLQNVIQKQMIALAILQQNTSPSHTRWQKWVCQIETEALKIERW